MNEVLYTSCLCSETMEKKLLEADPKCVGLQIQKYHRLLAKGFYENGVEVEALSHPRGIESVVESDRWSELENGIHYTYLTNSRGGYAKLLRNSFKYAYQYLKHHRDAVIVCDVLNFTVSFGAALAARVQKRKVIGIVTDFPEQLSGKPDLNSRLIWGLVRLCTGYVVLSEYMKKRLNPQKPAIVLEGHVDSGMKLAVNTIEGKYPTKVCLYAGSLHRKNGIEKLVKAFSAADIKEAELHIYGDGDYAEELRTMKNEHIRYYGKVPNDVVVNEEVKATLLINPRPTDAEFTKYSFPSKNLEYMASGTPLLTTKLPGMPIEHIEYVYLFGDETVEGMSRTLNEVLSKPRKELHQKGMNAKQYVMENKTESVQAKKILKMAELCKV